MFTDRRLWLTADGKRVVDEGDPKANTLFAAEGDEILDEVAKKFKIKRLKKPVEDKAAAPGEDKSGDDPKPGLTMVRRKSGETK